jgi:hypothetical protein
MTARVGPILRGTVDGWAIAAAIVNTNADCTIDDRGGYLRVSAPGVCRLSRSAAEEALGRPFSLSMELEPLMPSFVGQLLLAEAAASWVARSEGGQR